MPEDGVETIPEVPTLMKSLEDVDELCLGQAVEVRHDRIQLVDHVVLLVRLEWPTLDTDGIGPGPEAFVGASQPPRKSDHAPPPCVVTRGTRDRERVEDKVVQMRFDEPPRVPVERYRGQDTDDESLIVLISPWPEEVRRLIADEYLGRHERHPHGSRVRSPRYVPKGHARRKTGQRRAVAQVADRELPVRAVAPPFPGPQALVLDPREGRLRIGPGVVRAGVRGPDVERLALVDRPEAVRARLAFEVHEVLLVRGVKLGIRSGAPLRRRVQVESRRLAELQEDVYRIVMRQQRQGRAVVPSPHFVPEETHRLAHDVGVELRPVRVRSAEPQARRLTAPGAANDCDQSNRVSMLRLVEHPACPIQQHREIEVGRTSEHRQP